TRNPRASMSWMSAVVNLARVGPNTRLLTSSFGVRLLSGGLRKSEGLSPAAQSATLFAPPSTEKYASVGAFILPSNRRLAAAVERTKSRAGAEFGACGMGGMSFGSWGGAP